MILLETNNRVVEESVSVRIKNALAGYAILRNYIDTSIDRLFIKNYLCALETNRKTRIY